MAQLAVPDELADRIYATAERCGRTPEGLLETIFTELMESDEAFAERMLTPDIQARMLRDLSATDHSGFIGNEEVDRKFEALRAPAR